MTILEAVNALDIEIKALQGQRDFLMEEYNRGHAGKSVEEVIAVRLAWAAYREILVHGSQLLMRLGVIGYEWPKKGL